MRPMPSPSGMVTPGARNFRGASRKEIARTMPSHTKTAAPATAADVEFTSVLLLLCSRAHLAPASPGRGAVTPYGLGAGSGRDRS